ncbi:fumarylacetoacetate hydrolase family protein [Effusibacillus dendaii]|uniref:2-hydroxyhepta-2,4-diene-1,7-dioate isomerase n=1 Tax=Effusibacillus dendaii TaxID=2743772 RepID=A0A7I8DC02_9BACL|nr:fumarylacetoacetate hydrolase family protein [Effusibacillus dendaii]BCJ87703.1 2-hydroxyhepta-2,4-diene-1,7-dioate isomerase [Effusibacillus dendaii]
MKLFTFNDGKRLKLGINTEKGLLDLTKVLQSFPNPSVPQTMEQLIAGGETHLQELESFVNRILKEVADECFLREEETVFGPCVPNPGKIICVGLNYRKHAVESNMRIPEYPVLFNKFDNSISAHKEVIPIPYNAEQIDYEAELVMVIGKKAKQVAKKNALDYVLGYCNGNDLSVRELQFRTNQWLLGKTSDGFCPIGPYLVTADEIENPNNLDMKTYVNREIRQNSNTADMIFHCDELISYISHYMALNPGDIIMTGTPEGVILGYPKEDQHWLKSGDEMVIEISGLGRLINQLG